MNLGFQPTKTSLLFLMSCSLYLSGTKLTRRLAIATQTGPFMCTMALVRSITATRRIAAATGGHAAGVAEVDIATVATVIEPDPRSRVPGASLNLDNTVRVWCAKDARVG